MPRSHQAASGQTRTRTPAPQSGGGQGGASNHAAQGGRGGGVLGWFRQAGAWVGDKVGGAAAAVGDWADQTAQFTRDAVEAVSSTSVGLDDGTLYVEADLDELSDLMSSETRAALGLDRATADNRVRMTYDRATGQVVATSDQIALAGVDTDALQAGQIILTDVRAVFTNKGGGVPGLGDDFRMLGYQDAADNLQAVVTIASARAVDVHFHGPNGPTSVDTVALDGLSGTVGAQGGMPFAEAGTTEVSFALEHAVLEGLAANGHTVASADVSAVTGGMSGSQESAFLTAEAVAVAGVSGSTRAGDAQLEGLRVDVDNRGGGLLGADDTADKVRARVAVEAASVSDLDTADFDAKQLSARGVSGALDTTTGSGGASVQRLGTEGLDTSWVDANRLSLSDLSVDGDLTGRNGRREADFQVGSVTGDGLTVTPTTDGRTAAGAGTTAMDWSATLGSADFTNSSVSGATIGRTRATDAVLGGAIDGDESTLSAELGEATLTDFSHEALTADTLSTTGTTLAANADSVHASADQVRGSQVRTTNLRAASLSAAGGTASVDQGTAFAAFDQARVGDATILDRIDIATADVTGLEASTTGPQSTVQFASGSVSDVSDRVTGAALTEAALTQGSFGHNARTAGVTGQLARADVAGVSGMGGTLQSGTASDIGFARVSGSSSLSAQSASVQGLTHGTTSIGSASGTRLSGTQDASGLRAEAQTAQAQQIQAGDTASVASAWAHGLAVGRDDTGARASVDQANLQDIHFATDATTGSMSSASIQSGTAHQSASGVSAGAGSVRVQDLAAQGTGGSVGALSGGVDMARAFETSAANLEDAEISAQGTLHGGDLGVAGLRAEPGTGATAGLSIRDGRVQDEGTGLGFSERLDGPLWTSVQGAYMDDGRLKADVRGWMDKDVTSDLNEALGVGGDRVPDVATIGRGVAAGMRQPSGSGSGLSQAVDMGSVQMDARAQLGTGVIDSGVGQVDLAKAERAGDNLLDLSVRDHSLEASIQRFLADSSAYSAGGTTASTGQAAASGIDMSASPQSWSLTADEIEAKDVRGSQQ